MTFSISVFLYIYIAFLIVWFILCLTAIYHMFKFGFKNFATFLSTFIFIFIAILMLSSSFYYISGIDWTVNISIMDGIFDRSIGF